MKRFIFASLTYFAVAAIFGILNGVTDVGYWGVFAHTHFNLLGFMSMMIYGIGYFILPRFNGTELRFPNWVPVHFWLGNISLVGMVVFRGLEIETGETVYQMLFIIFAVLQVTTIAMFILNIWMALSASASQSEQPTPTTAKSGETASSSQQAPSSPAGQLELSADSPLAAIIDAYPAIQDLLVQSGLQSLASQGHLDRVRSMGITIGMAANNHGINLEKLLESIRQEISGSGSSAGNATETQTIDDTQLIGTIMQEYPESRVVFEKYFGSGCFDCPGQAYESIDMACRMHGVDPKTFLSELNSTLAGV